MLRYFLQYTVYVQYSTVYMSISKIMRSLCDLRTLHKNHYNFSSVLAYAEFHRLCVRLAYPIKYWGGGGGGVVRDENEMFFFVVKIYLRSSAKIIHHLEKFSFPPKIVSFKNFRNPIIDSCL